MSPDVVERLVEALRMIAYDPAESSQMYEWAARDLARATLAELGEELPRG